MDRDLLLDNLASTPLERIRSHQRAHERAGALREAVVRKHGFDPDEDRGLRVVQAVVTLEAIRNRRDRRHQEGSR